MVTRSKKTVDENKNKRLRDVKEILKSSRTKAEGNQKNVEKNFSFLPKTDEVGYIASIS